ncbi:MAG TPA: PfkB family carbohydrate kinase, partial [Pirellulales bacterium]|jgi:sugar/nucleoside kinase (ribokinase family)|nr:PfkB family carbohydrate kinase [Pirellulales bacterium]
LLVADHLCAPIPQMPRAGQLVLTDHLLLNIGGCASNAAMDLARLGVKVGVVGCVGGDVFGRFVIETLESAGIDTSTVRPLANVGTSGTLIVNVAGEDRRFIHAVGANGKLTASDIPLERVRQAKVFYVGGYLLTPGLDQDELAELFREARAAGVTTVLDVVLPGPGDHGSKLVRLLPETDVFLPNDDEAALITGLSDPRRQAEWFHEAGAGTVAITCGGRGSVLVSDGLRIEAGAYPVDYVGATGAGDAFDAGYIAGLLQGGDPVRCLEWGSALGASCVRSIGATESVFNRAEAEEYMRTHELKVKVW